MNSCFTITFLLFFIHFIKPCFGKISNTTCPEDVWAELGHKGGALNFKDVRLIDSAGAMAQNTIRYFLKKKKFEHKMKVEEVLSGDRQMLGDGSELYTMKVRMHHTLCKYNIYMHKNNTDNKHSRQKRHAENCEVRVPRHKYFNGTCCLQFIVKELPQHNLTFRRLGCIQAESEAVIPEIKHSNSTTFRSESSTKNNTIAMNKSTLKRYVQPATNVTKSKTSVKIPNNYNKHTKH